jgi:ribose transport system substrate-binding protein
MLDGIIEWQLANIGNVNLEVIFQGYTAWTEDQAVTVMEDALSLNKDFNVLLSEADVMTMSAMKVLQEAGKLDGKLVVAAADGQKEALEMIKNGENYGCTGMNSPTAIAELAIDSLEKYFNGQAKFPAKTYTPAACVTKDNVDEYYDPNSTF